MEFRIGLPVQPPVSHKVSVLQCNVFKNVNPESAEGFLYFVKWSALIFILLSSLEKKKLVIKLIATRYECIFVLSFMK
jgi:hypothetical protein